MSQEEIVRYKIKNAEFKAKVKSDNERFTVDNIIRVTEHDTLPQVIEKSIAENKTPVIIRQSKYENYLLNLNLNKLFSCLISKQEIFGLLHKENREIDLRQWCLHLRKCDKSIKHSVNKKNKNKNKL